MKKTIRDFDLKNKQVLMRCDFNVPIKNNQIVDDTRIVASIPTIQYAIDCGAKIILFSHLGRIKQQEDLFKNSLEPVSKRLEELLGQKVFFSKETRGKELEQIIEKMQPGDVLLVENTRFEDLDGKKESKNDPELGSYWASLGDIFINDAFGTSHRSHASNVGIASHLPSGIGFLIEKELQVLSSLEKPNRPYVVILGGAKVQDKIGVIENLIHKADKILVGGGMAFTFLKAQGYEIGTSLLDAASIDFCSKMLKEHADKIVLPIDAVTSKSLEAETNNASAINQISSDEMGLDIGEDTILLFEKYLKDAKTVVWNGPLGAYEYPKYQHGTKEILEFLTQTDATVILGGGDIVAAATQLGYKDKVTHCSTGGGATLEYLEGKTLPGIAVIQEKE